VAPINGRAQRLLAVQRRAAAARQQSKAVIQPRRDLLRSQRAYTRRRQFDGKRHAIQSRTNERDRRRIRISQRKPGFGGAGAFYKQPDRRVAPQLLH